MDDNLIAKLVAALRGATTVITLPRIMGNNDAQCHIFHEGIRKIREGDKLIIDLDGETKRYRVELTLQGTYTVQITSVEEG